jgi:hypothetical protein
MTLEQKCSATPNASKAKHAPTISAMKSTAPASRKCTFFDGCTMHLGFGFRQALKHGGVILFYRRGQLSGSFAHAQDVRQVVVGFGLAAFDVKFGGGNCHFQRQVA